MTPDPRRFRLAPHTAGHGQVVEIWVAGRFVGTLYPTSGGFKIITKERLIVDTTPSDELGLQVATVDILP